MLLFVIKATNDKDAHPQRAHVTHCVNIKCILVQMLRRRSFTRVYNAFLNRRVCATSVLLSVKEAKSVGERESRSEHGVSARLLFPEKPASSGGRAG